MTYIGSRPYRLPRTGIRIRFGNHCQTHSTAEAVLGMLDDVWKLECDVDPGTPMDTFLVCNGGWPEEANKFISHIDGQRTTRGILRVLSRENTGLSFGGYSYTFKKFHDDYKYWVFTEDDIMFTKSNYLADSLQMMRRDHCQFVTPLPISDKHRRPHCYGGVGCTRRGALDIVANHFGGELPYAREEPRIKADGRFRHHPFVRHGEIVLTNTMIEKGLKIQELLGLVEFYHPWKQNQSLGIS